MAVKLYFRCVFGRCAALVNPAPCNWLWAWGCEMSGAGWTAVPNEVLTDTRLTPTERLLYALLCSYDWQDGNGSRKGYCWPSQATLAELLGCTPRTVRAALARLQTLGYIAIERNAGGPGGGGTNRYTLIAPDQSDRKPTSARSESDRKPTSSRLPTERKPTSAAIGSTLPTKQTIEEYEPAETDERDAFASKKLTEFLNALKAQVAPSTFAAYLSDLEAVPRDGVLTITQAHPMARERLWRGIQSAAAQAGFERVEVAEVAGGER